MEFIKAKSIISNYIENNPWFSINYNMNIYKGCPHGCIYCDSRSSCYQIIDFDRVRIKENSIEMIKKELKGKRKKGVIGTGAMSDPYNPFEAKYMLTRDALKLINDFKFGVSIATKSNLITRDIEILKEIQKHSPVLVKITITTYDDNLCKQIEPHVVTSSKRFEAIKKLSENGIFTGILLMPILPFINDSEENVKEIVRKAYECGAKFIFSYGMGVTLRQNQREYYYDKLRTIFSKDIVNKYIEIYGDRYEYESIKSKKLRDLFELECNKYNILYKMEDIIDSYKNKYETCQLNWF
ncbi:radical SAM protein [Faecalimicrobium sp. JNUCC 81]